MRALPLSLLLVAGVAVPAWSEEPHKLKPSLAQKCYSFSKKDTGNCGLNSFGAEGKAGGLGWEWMCLNDDGTGVWAVIAWSNDSDERWQSNDTWHVSLSALDRKGNSIHAWDWEYQMLEANKHYEWRINPVTFPTTLFDDIDTVKFVGGSCFLPKR